MDWTFLKLSGACLTVMLHNDKKNVKRSSGTSWVKLLLTEWDEIFCKYFDMSSSIEVAIATEKLHNFPNLPTKIAATRLY